MTDRDRRFSLIVPTLGRVDELYRLFDSLTRQTCRDFELIVVDQNDDARLDPVMEMYRDTLSPNRIRPDGKGAAYARNKGLKHARGEIITFPDDDCWYPETLLEEIDALLREHEEYAAVSVQARDEAGSPSVCNWDGKKGRVTWFNEIRRSIEFGMFFRRTVFEDVGGYNESFGPGAITPWGGHEGSDLNLRALEAGHVLFYRPNLFIYHPQKTATPSGETIQRGRQYGRDMGRLFRMHGFPFWYVLYWWFRPLGGAAWALARGCLAGSRFHVASLRGRVEGWLHSDSLRQASSGPIEEEEVMGETGHVRDRGGSS